MLMEEALRQRNISFRQSICPKGQFTITAHCHEIENFQYKDNQHDNQYEIQNNWWDVNLNETHKNVHDTAKFTITYR